jgi:hypothetical protein
MLAILYGIPFLHGLLNMGTTLLITNAHRLGSA